MRVTSAIWVRAYLRRVAAGQAAAFVVHHGDDTAGAILIKVNRLDGTAALFGPAPAGLASVNSERSWTEQRASGTAEGEIDQEIIRQRDFDPDVWVVEVEDRAGRHFLDGWLA